MILKNSLNYINQFFFFIINKTRFFYLNSNIYNKKISKTNDNNLEYKPSPNLLDALIKYKKKKNKIEDYILSSIWESKNINKSDYKKLHSFFWLSTLDLKSSKLSVQSVILNWINKNKNYDAKKNHLYFNRLGSSQRWASDHQQKNSETVYYGFD